MGKIVDFTSENEFKLYRLKKANKYLGGGSQGNCYLGRDGLVYKDLTEGFLFPEMSVNEVITTDRISLESFIFPNILFSINGCLIGHTSKYVANDLFDEDLFFDYGVNHIDFNKLIDAYYNMMSDAEKLADANIKIFDLSHNIMFDGNKLYGIDTDYYRKVDYPILEHNRSCVDNALKDVFVMVAEYVFDDNLFDLSRSMNVVDFLNYIRENYSEKGLSLNDGNIIQYLK